MKVSLSAAKVSAMVPQDKNYYVYDAKVRSLAVKVTPAGSRIWYFIRSVAGKMKFIKIGPFPEVTPETARRTAEEYSRQLNGLGEVQRDLTLGELLDAYFTDRKERKGDTRSLAVSIGRLRVVPDLLLRRFVSRVRRADMQQLLFDASRLFARSARSSDGRRSASLLLVDIRAAFNYGIRMELIPNRNPAAGVSIIHSNERERFLSEEELHRFFAALGDADPDFADFVRLLLFTGKRRSNVIAMQWSWINWEAGTLTIPAASEKTRHVDRTILAAPALEVLRRRFASPGRSRSPFVFPSELSRTGHYVEPRRAWQTLCTAAHLDDLHLHDLRRTVGSWAAGKGYSLHMVAAILGQTSIGATGVYARLADGPKRAAVADVIGSIASAGGHPTDPAELARQKVIRALRDPAVAVKLASFL